MKTGRPKSENRMIRRTVRNDEWVDTALLRQAKKRGTTLAVVLREACAEKASRSQE